TVCGLLFLLAGAVGQTVIYPLRSTCDVRGSTATLRCTFTPLKSFKVNQTEVPPKIVRVLWCQNHRYCYTNTPSVCDSDSANIDPHNASFRFRMEADHPEGRFTNQTGVTVRVDGERKMSCRGENVTLLCTFHQLEVTWFKDGHALSDTGPSLLLILTAEDSGSYTCGLKTNMETVSEPHSLNYVIIVVTSTVTSYYAKIRNALLVTGI
uniref:Ig-like domain-containing protein n=1 Tax=Maylandia zebra TaxID=106582 RepID=A0A3P9CL15_9CICH